MNGPEHYLAAQALVADAREVWTHNDYGSVEQTAKLLAEAQIHATLALVAATIHDRLGRQYAGNWNEALA